MQGDEDDEEFDPNWDEEDDLEAQGTHLIYDSPLELSCPVLLIEDVLKGNSAYLTNRERVN